MATILERLRPLRMLVFRGNAAEAMRFYQSVLGGELKLQLAEAVLGEHCAEKGLVFTSSLWLGRWWLSASDAMTPEIAALPNDPRSVLFPTLDPARWSAIVRALHGGTTPVQVTKLTDDTHVARVAELVDRFEQKWMILLLRPRDAPATKAGG